MTLQSSLPAKRGRPENAASKSGQVRALLKTGMSAADIAKKVGCTTGLVYNLKSSSGGGSKRGPGRPRKGSTDATFDGIAGIVAAVKNSEQQRTQLRGALERIQSIIADALN